MIKGTTESGFAFEIDENVLDDYELWENLIEVEEGRTTRIAPIVNSLLGKQQKKALMDHLRGDSGRVPIGKVFETVGEILRAAKKQEKN